jgi:hypothetical protein
LNDAIADASCEIDPSMNAELVQINVVSITEFFAGGSVFKGPQLIIGPFVSEESFTYQSPTDPSQELPTTIEIKIFGEDADGDPVTSSTNITFTNNCSAYPIFPPLFPDGSNQLGYLLIVSDKI